MGKVLIACDAELVEPTKELTYVCEWYCDGCKARNLTDSKDKPSNKEVQCSVCKRKSKITEKK